MLDNLLEYNLCHLLVGVGSVSEQDVHHLRVSLGGGEVEWSPLVLVRTPTQIYNNASTSKKLTYKINEFVLTTRDLVIKSLNVAEPRH